jgi:hypothetical protein
MNSVVTVKQVNDNGSCGDHKTKAYSKTVTPPTAAEVRTDWTVKNPEKKVTQGTTIPLVKGSGSGLTVNFVTKPNPVSNYNKPQIYTDVTMKGTKQKPVKHTITVYASGGGVNGVPFCKSISLSFTINGDMYEDDFTVDTM